MGPRRTLGKCKLQTHQSQDPYSHPETNFISEETGHSWRLCFKWRVVYNCRLSAFGRLRQCCICLFFLSSIYTSNSVFSTKFATSTSDLILSLFWVIWSKCQVCHGLGLSRWLLLFTIFDLIFLVQHKSFDLESSYISQFGTQRWLIAH